MQYQISRNGQMYGPYTYEDLARYVSSGNVLPTDMAKNETMTDWVPVSQILAGGGNPSGSAQIPSASPFSQPSAEPTPYGNAPGYTQPGFAQPAFAQPAYGQPVYGQPAYGVPAMGMPAVAAYPDPPSMSWGLVLLCDVFTFGLFQLFWNVYISVWLKKVVPNQTPLICYAAAAVLNLLSSGIAVPIVFHSLHGGGPSPLSGLTSLFGLIVFVLKLIGRYSFRSSLQAQYGMGGPENINIDVNPVLLFFFGGLYLQSHLSQIASLKTAARMNSMQGR